VLNAATQTSPAIARLGGRIYVLYAPLGLFQHAYSTSTWSCPKPDDTPCGTWGGWDNHPYMDAFQGLDALTIPGPSGTQRLLVVGTDSSGTLIQTILTVSSGVEHWTTPTRVNGSLKATGEPSLAMYGPTAIYLVYRGTDGFVKFQARRSDGTWTSATSITTPDWSGISVPDYTSPAIAFASLRWQSGPVLYGAFAASDGRLDLWARDSSTGHWVKTDMMETRPGPVEGRPALQWVPFQSTSFVPGRLYLMFIRHNTSSPGEREINMMMSYVKKDSVSGTNKQYMGLLSPFDNVWLYGLGIDLLYTPGIDSNLRAAFTVGANYGGDNPDSPKKFQVWFRPNADGIYDYSYRNFNDWQTLQVGVCKYVVDPGDALPHSTQIQCPAH